MNVVFWLLLLVTIFLAWFILSFLFKPIGKFFMRLYSDAMEQMKESEDTKETEETENKTKF